LGCAKNAEAVVRMELGGLLDSPYWKISNGNLFCK
jgi:hypothetical protein